MQHLNKPHITYLFGAGASYQALPLVKPVLHQGNYISSGLSKDLGDLGEHLFRSGEISPKNNNVRNRLIENLKHLSKESSKYSTVDTYAKYLFLKQKYPELDRLKETLSFFFSVRQFVDGKFDERYLVYLINVLESGIRFPENVKIISYNYDFQVQLAAKYFNDGLINFYPGPGFQSKLDTNEEYNLIHLNGIAGMMSESSQNYLPFTQNNDLNGVFETMGQLRRTKHHLLFAWEHTQRGSTGTQVEIALKMINKTQILVVIGYSFPFFNREVDSMLFDTMKKGSLKKIYFQDPVLDGEFLRQQFDLPEIDIKHVMEVSNFFVPKEL